MSTSDDNITISDNSSTSYVHGGLDNGTRYYYKLVANKASGISALSNEVSGLTLGPTPAPDNLTATADTGMSAGKNTLSWAALSGADNYTLYFSTSSPAYPGGTQISIAGGSTSYTHTGLTPYTTYYYQLVANNSFGSSSPSSEASARPTNSLTCAQTSGATGTPASGYTLLGGRIMDNGTMDACTIVAVDGLTLGPNQRYLGGSVRLQ